MGTEIRGTWIGAAARCLAGTALAAAALVAVGAPPAAAHTPHDNVVDTELSPDFAEDRTVFTIVREYLLRSTDGGETWTRLVRGLDNKHVLSAMEISAADPKLLYVGSRGSGVHRSTDGGETWTPASKGLEKRRNVMGLALAPYDDQLLVGYDPYGGAVLSRDGADSWETVQLPGEEHVWTAAIAPDEGGPIVLGVEGGILRSDDEGRSWTRVDLDTDEHVTTVAFSPDHAEDGTFWVGTESSGVFVTTDGESFEPASDGLDDDRGVSLHVSAGYAEDRTLWASTWEDGVYRSEDGGESWEDASEGLSTDSMADDLGRAHFLAVTGGPTPHEDLLFVDGFDGLFRSEDGGETWEQTQTQISTNIISLAVSPDYAKDRTVFAASYLNGLARSTDEGATWTHHNAGFTTWFEYTREPDFFARLTGVHVSPTYREDETVYVGARGYLHTSKDRGGRFTPVVPEGIIVKGEDPPDYFLPVFSPAYEDDGIMLAGTDGGKIFRGADGETFRKVAEIGAEVVAIVVSPAFAEDRTVLVATPEGFQRSTDAGDTWEVIDGAPKAPTSLTVSSDFAEDRTLLLGTKNGLFRSTDAGDTWTRVQPLPGGRRAYVEAVVASPDSAEEGGVVLLSVRGHGLFRSTDNGRTFAPAGQDLLEDQLLVSSFYHPTGEPIVFSPGFAQDRTVFAQASDVLLRSTDGGVTWEREKIPQTTHSMDEAEAPNELLRTPTWEDVQDGAAGDTGGVTGSTRAAAKGEVLILTSKRVLAAVGAGVLALAVAFVVRLGTRSKPERLALYLRFTCSALVFAVALYVLGQR